MLKSLGTLTFIALVIASFSWFMYNTYNTIVYGPPPVGSKNMDAYISGNESGPYVVVKVKVPPSGAWIEGVIVTNDIWMLHDDLNSPETANYLLTHYPVYEVHKFVNKTTTIVIPFRKTGMKLLAGYSPIFRGKVVVGEHLVPLDKLGKVIMYEKPEMKYNVFFSAEIFDKTTGDMIVYNRSKINEMHHIAEYVAERNDTQALGNFTKWIGEQILKSMTNGTILIGYDRSHPLNTSQVKEKIRQGSIGVKVELEVRYDNIIGEIVKNTSLGTYKYYIDKVLVVTSSYNSLTNKTEVKVTDKSEIVSPSTPLPFHRYYAIFVIWAKTPYSPLHAYGYKAPNLLVKYLSWP